MRRTWQILVLVVLALAPVFSLANSVTGRPLCCWGRCRMAHMSDMAQCQMQSACNAVTAVPAIAAPLSVPLFARPPARRTRPARRARARWTLLRNAVPLGFPLEIFHPPLA
ncbi:MAG: hypothetical protein ACRD04_03665 [Terriglobales bacterium]